MANARRSLGEAMTLSPDQRAFIHGGVKPPTEPIPSVKVIETPPISLDSSVEAMPEKSEPEPQAKSRRQRSNTRPRLAIPLDEEEPMAPILAPLTTRLHPETADALRRACLEQRLRRRKPHTQQEIVELAVRGWLETNGFMGED